MDLQVHKAGKWQSNDLNPGQKAPQVDFKPLFHTVSKSRLCAMIYGSSWRSFHVHTFRSTVLILMACMRFYKMNQS